MSYKFAVKNTIIDPSGEVGIQFLDSYGQNVIYQPHITTTGDVEMSGNYLMAKNLEIGIEQFEIADKKAVINVFSDKTSANEYCIACKHERNGNADRKYLNFKSNGILNSAGSITGQGNFQVSYNTLSDSRLKTDISNVITRNEYVESRSTADDKADRPWLDTLEALDPITFKFKDPSSGEVDINNTYVGFIAEQVRQVYPQAVTGISGEEIDGVPQYQQMDMSKLIPLIVGAIKELAIKIVA